MARLDFPLYKNFVLNRGEDYLAQMFNFWGADLSAYLTYCAFTNQFVNCTLKEIKYKTILFLKEDEIQLGLQKYFNMYFGEDYSEGLFSFSNFNLAYHNFRESLFGNFTLKYQKKDKEKWETISHYKNQKFERQLLRFVAHIYYARNYHNLEDYEAKETDADYTRSQYFLDGISCSKDLNLEELDYNEEQKDRILAFQNLNYFREKLIRKITPYSWGSEQYNFLPVKPFSEFITREETSKFNQLISYFRNDDVFIKNGVFEFLRKFSTMNSEQKKNSFYTILLDDFFNFEQRETLPKPLFEERRRQVKPLESVKELPDPTRTINLIEPQDYAFPQEYLDAIQKLADEHYGGDLQAYYKSFEEDFS